MNEEEIEGLIRENQVTAIHLMKSEQQFTRSKLGGLPDISADFIWPTWNNRSLSFIAQLDLFEMSQIEIALKLPNEGMLYFFYDQNQSTWGFDPKDIGSWRVIYSSNHLCLSQASPPPDLLGDFIFTEKFLSPRSIMSFPSLERLNINLSLIAEAAFDFYFEIQNVLLMGETAEHPVHQVGGFPNSIQSDCMELEAQLASNGIYCDEEGYQSLNAQNLADGAKDWCLLLQVDSDDDTKMMWGDVGRLYFWIRKQDLAMHEFSKVWMVLQCS